MRTEALKSSLDFSRDQPKLADMPFKPLNPSELVKVHRKSLPHWRQHGVTYFVTSRLADSLPANLLEFWRAERMSWLQSHKIDSTGQLSDLHADLQQEYHRLFTVRFHELLDAGHGACHLRRQEVARIVTDLFAESSRSACELDAWVVMPNHYHSLVTPREGVKLGDLTQRWKGASSRRINLLLGRSGRLWQPEGFDHIVRSEPQLQRFRKYIAENPAKAGLRSGYVLGIGPDCDLTEREVLNRFGIEK